MRSKSAWKAAAKQIVSSKVVTQVALGDRRTLNISRIDWSIMGENWLGEACTKALTAAS